MTNEKKIQEWLDEKLVFDSELEYRKIIVSSESLYDGSYILSDLIQKFGPYSLLYVEYFCDGTDIEIQTIREESEDERLARLASIVEKRVKSRKAYATRKKNKIDKERAEYLRLKKKFEK